MCTLLTIGFSPAGYGSSAHAEMRHLVCQRSGNPLISTNRTCVQKFTLNLLELLSLRYSGLQKFLSGAGKSGIEGEAGYFPRRVPMP